jgi:preprotein translocase subunit SecE
MLKGKVQEGLQAVRGFVGETVQEGRKSNWPGRQELFESTVVVIASLVLLSLFVGVCDHLLVVLLRLMLPTG